MYKKHFGFIEKPFSIIPNPKFLYLSPKHQNALTYLEYGIMEKLGFVLLTGEIGIGKTTLVRHLLNQVKEELEVAIIFNTNIDADQLIRLILQEFEITPVSDDKTKNIETIYHFLIKKYSEGRRVLLIIDEAQNLSDEVLEEVRMLSNFHSDNETFLQTLLVGQPELRTKLNSPRLTQLRQRIAASYHIAAMDGDEVKEYLRVRLKKAGCSRKIFRSEAIARIIAASGGIPRTINIICDTALVYGYGDGSYTIGVDTIDQVLADNTLVWQCKENGGAQEQIAAINAETSQVLVDFEARLGDLEKKIVDHGHKLDRQLDELRQNFTDHSKDMLVEKLTTQIRNERRISDDYLRQYTALREKYLHLSAQGDNQGE